jgi:hypothetical protein
MVVPEEVDGDTGLGNEPEGFNPESDLCSAYEDFGSFP